MQLVRERERIVAAARRLAGGGQVTGTAGNLSERAGSLVAVTPTGAALDLLTPEQIAVVDLDGEHVDGDLAPTSELGLHLGVYRRYGAGAVVHTHPPFGTALSCVLDELPVIHYQMLALGGPVRVAPYATFGTDELAEATLDALEGTRRRADGQPRRDRVSGPTSTRRSSNRRCSSGRCTLYWRGGRDRDARARSTQTQRMAVVERGHRARLRHHAGASG